MLTNTAIDINVREQISKMGSTRHASTAHAPASASCQLKCLVGGMVFSGERVATKVRDICVVRGQIFQCVQPERSDGRPGCRSLLSGRATVRMDRRFPGGWRWHVVSAQHRD